MFDINTKLEVEPDVTPLTPSKKTPPKSTSSYTSPTRQHPTLYPDQIYPPCVVEPVNISQPLPESDPQLHPVMSLMNHLIRTPNTPPREFQ